MLTPTVGRAVRSTGSISAASACTLSRPAALGAVQQSFSRPSHQRRLSSSKASIPPDGSNTNGPSSPQQTPASANKAPSRKVTGRSSKKRAVAPALNVPHVPPTDYLQKPEVKISSFFSLHRPISLTTPIPPVSTNTSFDSIFKARAPNDRKQVSNNIQVISSGIESLEAALNLDDSRQAAEDISIQANVEVQHMDGPPQASLDQLMARLVPFRPPPVPELDQGSFESSALGMIEEAPATSPAKQRAWSTAVVVTESTDSSGNRTYSASTAPMVEIPVPDAGNGQEMDEMDIHQPFLERMTRRQVTHNRRRDNLGRPDMLAISVKRQRKLKMKKHKYKKLMKRTRLERKKLDRL